MRFVCCAAHRIRSRNYLSMRFFFRKDQRLHREAEISPIFKEGKRLFVFPVKCVYRVAYESTDAPRTQVLIVAAKSNLKRAYLRNLAKRRMREAYRLNAPMLDIPQGLRVQMALLYVGKNSVAPYSAIEKSVKAIFSGIESHLNNNANKVEKQKNAPQ